MENANTRCKRDDPDFISSLPDPILHHILGLLKTKEAVQTCVLSKRWQHLWTFLPSLHFDSGYFSSSRNLNFVNAVLLRRKPLPLDVFRAFDDIICDKCLFFDVSLCVGYFPSEFSAHVKQVGDLIQYALKHKTRVLHLASLFLHCCCYPYISLEELHLYGHYAMKPGIINFPRLRKLTIFHGVLLNDFLENLLFGSPVLEYLSLNNISHGECIINHECLKHLAIIKFRASFITKYQLFVSAPNLLSFFYDGELPFSYFYETILNMPSLTSACLVIRDSSTIKCLKGMAAILPSLANVERLELHLQCDWQKELPSVLRAKLPILHKLKDLTVAFSTSSCFQMVTWILKSSPNLKKLTLLEQEAFLTYAKRGASAIELTNTSSRVSVSSCKNLEMIEVKHNISDRMIGHNISDRMIGQLVYGMIDGTKDNWYTLLSKHKSNITPF